jgi:hypothetical protein
MKILSKYYTASSGTIFNTKGNEKYNVRGKTFILNPKRHLFVKDKQFVKDITSFKTFIHDKFVSYGKLGMPHSSDE